MSVVFKPVIVAFNLELAGLISLTFALGAIRKTEFVLYTVSLLSVSKAGKEKTFFSVPNKCSVVIFFSAGNSLKSTTLLTVNSFTAFKSAGATS